MSDQIIIKQSRINRLRSLGRVDGWRGLFSVEFALVLMIALTLFAFAGEVLRISMIDQTLARATHLAARAIATAPSSAGCHALANTAISADRASAWLLDSDDDGTIVFDVATATGWPVAVDGTEVQLTVSWDQNPADGIDYSDTVGSGCGDTGSWLRVRSRIAVRPWYGLFRTWIAAEGIVLRHESWGRNNRL